MDQLPGRLRCGNQPSWIEEKKNRERRIVWDLWDNIKDANIHINRVPKGKKRKKKKNTLFE